MLTKPVKVCEKDSGIGFACFGFKTKGNSKELFRKIPLVDLSIKWDDDLLYKLFGLSCDDISHIDKYVKGN